MKNFKGLITLVTLLSLSACNANIFYSDSDSVTEQFDVVLEGIEAVQE